jgi:type VI secretion system protein ImpM
MPGWFGKLSCLGDFAHRRLPQDWIEGCDEWLSRCVAHSRGQLGEQWLQVYLGAPLWRFVWGPGVADARWWFGLIMPSCDNVGRYFPLILAQARLQPPADGPGFAHLDAWWDHLRQSALATLEVGASVDDFESALSESPLWPSGEGVPALRPHALLEACSWDMPPGATVGELFRGVAARDLIERLKGQTLWWPWRSQGQSAPCVLAPGLPSAELFSSLLLAG